MRLFLALCLLLLTLPSVQAQPVKAARSQLACESLCGELFATIRAEPDSLVMRLEEALVISEQCAGDIVTAAIDAVNAEPAMVKKIVETALDMAPGRAAVITAAVQNYSATVVATAIPVSSAGMVEEIRRAELPDVVVASKPAAGEEVRRAELPLVTRSIPIVEVRRPGQAPMAVPAPHLMDIPKAEPMKSKK